MKVLSVLISAAALASVSSSAFAQQEMIPAENASRFLGKDAMVCGKVEKAKYAESSEGQPTFLYMGGAFPRHTFSVRIEGSNRGKFSFPPESLEGKDICALGRIQRDASRAQIEVNGPSNLKLATIK